MTGTEQLVLLLARGPVDLDAVDRIRACAGRRIDWNRLLRLSDAHGVAPLVARNLGALGADDVPDWARTWLDATRRLNTARNLLLVRALARVLACLAGIGIRAIALKGVALAEALHDDVGLRVCSDIDVLVPRQDVARALAALCALGYRPADGEPAIDARDLALLLAGNIEYALVAPDLLECPVELHWGVAWRWPRADRALEDLWAEASPRRAAGVRAWALSPEWELLYLAIHAARHRWEALKWLVDIHELCVRGWLDGARIQDKAKRFGLERILESTLGATRALLDTPLPRGLAAGAVPRWARLFPALPNPLGPWGAGASTAKLFSPWQRISYVARVAFLPTLAERRLIRLPAPLDVLYFALRPLRLGVKGGAGALRIGLRERRLPNRAKA